MTTPPPAVPEQRLFPRVFHSYSSLPGHGVFLAAAERGETRLAVEQWHGNDWRPLPCVLVDVSDGGLGVMTAALPIEGARVKVVLRVGEVALEATGRMIGHVGGASNEPAIRCGIRFDQPAPGLTAALADPLTVTTS